MTMPCLDLVPFVDGELATEPADAFRAHLLTCAACRAGLVEATQLSVRLASLTAAPPHIKLVPGPPAEPSPEPRAGALDGQRPETSTDAAAESPFAAPVDAPAPRDAGWGRSRRRTTVFLTAAMVPAAAALVVILLLPSDKPADAFAELTTRPYEIRFAYPDATSYRPMPDAKRGSSAGHADGVPYDALYAFQKRGEQYALAIARVWNGESPAKAAEKLRSLPETLAIRSDRAAVEMLSTTDDNVESLLAELEKLGDSTDPAARAARWNRALLLSRLKLPRSAAQAFRAIAKEREPGWETEALHRAEVEEQLAKDVRERWDRAFGAGKALIAEGAPIPDEVVALDPSLIRSYFYDAVRIAPSRERVQALLPLAASLDRLGDSKVLRDHVARIAGLDFARRAPLASAYAQLHLAGVAPSAAARAELTTDTPSPDVADIVMGAMLELGVVADHTAAYRRMVEQARDPWFEIILAEGEATAAEHRGDWLGAEARLLGAQKQCSDAISYRCLALARQLGTLYQQLHRIPQALDVVRRGLGRARSSGDFPHTFELLLVLADVELYNGSTATARTYANELLLMLPDSCAMLRPAQRILAAAAVRELDGRAARRALDLTLRCEPPRLETANDLADIGRLDRRPDDLQQLQDWLGKLRAGQMSAGERVLADEIEGRLLIERDRAAGIALLAKAIATAKTLAPDIIAERARAGAYAVLVFDAARQADHAHVMALVAEELGLAVPGSCAIGIVAEDERAVVVVRGADGTDRTRYDDARRPGAGPPAVPEALAQRLDGCAHVQVMARAAVQGQPRILPGKLAWSYATGAHGAMPPHDAPSGEPHVLIVANVTPPPYLQLPALSPRLPGPSPAGSAPAVVLSGPDATPARVLSAMRDATEIQFHTHALVDMGVSDASHLILSPGPGGAYALTAEAIRGIELRRRPVIVLAACHSARGARYQHAPWSLPHAFLAGGARAVFATGTDIPDADAQPFFDRVLERVRKGADPAAALRDERLPILAATPSSWVADVMVFE